MYVSSVIEEVLLAWHKALFPRYILLCSILSVVGNVSPFVAAATVGEADSFGVAAPNRERVIDGQPRITSLPADLQFLVSGRDLLVCPDSLGKIVFHVREPGHLCISNEIIELVTSPDKLQHAVLPSSRTSDTSVLPGVVDSSSVRLRIDAGQQLEIKNDFVVNSSTSEIEMISGQPLTNSNLNNRRI
jgi:hypothetical protein